MNPKFRIRRCGGNKQAWLLARIRSDGSESDSYGSWTTALSLDDLAVSAANAGAKPGDVIELVL